MSEREKNVLSVIIPALNEEKSVGPLVEKLRLVKCQILERTPVKDVEFIFVNDGSTDSTAQVMESYGNEIKVVTHPQNCGYGAALKSGFAAGRGDLLSFLDCDGTCHPLSLVKMCNILFQRQADLVIGNRMDRLRSQMPITRRLGNWTFAKLLSFLGGEKITDTASGIRVFNYTSYQRLSPLPDGLNFTPAMTARAVHEKLKIEEEAIDYAQRRGSSKLNVITHGLQFFWTILETVLLYNPLKVFCAISLILLLTGLIFIAKPVYAYITMQEPPFGYYLYRTIIALSFFLVSLQVFLFGALGGTVVNNFFHSHNANRKTERILKRLGIFHKLPIYGGLMVFAGLLVVAVYAYQYFFTAGISWHWSWLLLATATSIAGVQVFLTGLLIAIIGNIQKIKAS